MLPSQCGPSPVCERLDPVSERSLPPGQALDLDRARAHGDRVFELLALKRGGLALRVVELVPPHVLIREHAIGSPHRSVALALDHVDHLLERLLLRLLKRAPVRAAVSLPALLGLALALSAGPPLRRGVSGGHVEAAAPPILEQELLILVVAKQPEVAPAHALNQQTPLNPQGS